MASHNTETKRKQQGWTDGRLRSLFERQGGKCGVCGFAFDAIGDPRICRDHDHSTNKARGILCRRCNMGLGYFKDNVQSLLGAVRYIETYSPRREGETTEQFYSRICGAK